MCERVCLGVCVCGFEWSQLCGTHGNDSQSELIQNQSGSDGYPGEQSALCVCACVSVCKCAHLFKPYSALHLLFIAQMARQNPFFDINIYAYTEFAFHIFHPTDAK